MKIDHNNAAYRIRVRPTRAEIEVGGMMDKLKSLRLQYWAPSIPWMLLVFVIFFNMQSSSVFATGDDSSQFVESGFVARGHDVDELDSKHLFLSEKLHQMFNPLDMGANWQVSANYLWMPPLDVSGQGLVLYRNAGKFILEGDAQHVSGEPPSGAWIMLFNERGDLINDVYFSGTESIEAHVIYIGDMDHDGHLEWLLWGANVMGAGRDAKVAWKDVESKFSSYLKNPTVELYVMNDEGALEYKSGKEWQQQYRYGAEKVCPTTEKNYIYAPNISKTASLADIRAEKLTPYLCISAMQGTNDTSYIKDIIQRLQAFPRKQWKFKDFAVTSSTAGKPALQQALEQLGE